MTAMIGYNWKFKNLDFTDAVAMQNRVLLQNVEYNSSVRIGTTPNSNDHGSRVSKALANGRLFTFTAVIFDIDRHKRAATYKELVDTIIIQYNPSSSQYDDLYRTDDLGKPKTAKVVVFEEPRAINGLCDPTTEVTWSLYAPSAAVFDPTEKTATGGIGFLGGVSYPYSLPDPWGGAGNAIRVINNGNRIAPCKIEVNGQAESVGVYNATNISYLYTISGETFNYVLDNTEDVLINTDGKVSQLVTDQGADISFRRLSGSGVFLQPGINDIVVTSVGFDPDVTITFRDTYKLP